MISIATHGVADCEDVDLNGLSVLESRFVEALLLELSSRPRGVNQSHLSKVTLGCHMGGLDDNIVASATIHK